MTGQCLWPSASVNMDVLAAADDADILYRPCVDCGWRTGNFCGSNRCQAADYIPTENWAGGQITPLCIYCEVKYRLCHFAGEPHGSANLHMVLHCLKSMQHVPKSQQSDLDTPV